MADSSTYYRDHWVEIEPERLAVDRRVRAHDQLGILSPKARVVLGCLQLLDDPHIERIAGATGLTSMEVGHCIAELYAVYCRGDSRPL